MAVKVRVNSKMLKHFFVGIIIFIISYFSLALLFGTLVGIYIGFNDSELTDDKLSIMLAIIDFVPLFFSIFILYLYSRIVRKR